MVSISTVREGKYHDETCLLYPNDHPFVTANSFVKYSTCRKEPVEKLLRGVKAGLLVPRDPMDGAIFARVCQGVLQSRHTPLELKTLFEKATAPKPAAAAGEH